MCKKTSRQRVLLSTSCFGSPDLDLRPAPLQRHTMSAWAQECPGCGYVAASINDESGVEPGRLGREDYVTCSGLGLGSGLAERFYRQYLLALDAGDIEQAFSAILHAAWACDDKAGEGENAVKCRKIALVLIDRLIEEKAPHNDSLRLQRADLLRRAGEFGLLLEQYKDAVFHSELHNRIIAFQLRKAKMGDARRYTVRSAERDAE
ncbi:MAG: hypothetical protein IKB34_06050 [Clostridia bacterium]|nr:hypothetical protein [Clostridia bacterium]